MKHITLKLPNIAVSLALADILIKNNFLSFNLKEEIVVIIDVRDCEITNKYFLDYLISQIKKYSQVKSIIRRGDGPPAVKEIDANVDISYSALDFEILIDTLANNMTAELKSVGEYCSLKYTVPSLENLAIALLQRGFKLDKEVANVKED